MSASASFKQIKKQLPLYLQLMRVDRPIGTYLLLWPTLWALWIAAEGFPKWDVLLIFILGVIVMRAAGCVINDYADRNFDGKVERTRNRPLATGAVSAKEALTLFFILCFIAFLLVLLTNSLTIMLSFGGVLLAALYPFMKRYTHLPQVVLGAAFSWAIPMAYAAQTGTVPIEAWLLFCANLLWTVAYDTQYAMVDRNDDVKIGIKSTAILFGELDRHIIILLQALAVTALLIVAINKSLGLLFYFGLAVAIALFIYQGRLTWQRERQACFQAFLNNHWAGLFILIGIIADYTLF
ncbi:4-hydroxybenzoate polyprenyltransferase [Oceanospirillum multiglobuliferum]|uniref:4-hydroxybenzoate octaprenyltransferase n=1 Tax=Oceanospirillum multiglobuliferum TaxID=64969 RepID=A0A1T4NUC1_9GAMM|nr:4-hydroxybenzoate octaprenyltransferase [Oceanospirillum multiglobuliferum]OPX55660.1 4-hydroxybenzoate polyprenyltransferase [Oceanospirillum multiglobuliferum]SJZ82859.1 4-hydroxybenzoate polyprenyltransferase [Oceanospirillum multiglobuliferum]